METTPFVIFKSSAGSGKTYTLTTEYLKLAMSSPDAFRYILAVTFTNKATQEMKARILKELKRLQTDVKSDDKMDQEILEALGLDIPGLQKRAKEVLQSILHDYSRFSVSTIDSFFQKVVRAFAREMDLNAKFEIQLDQGQILGKVVDRVVEKVLEDEMLHRWLVDYAEEQIKEGNSWKIRDNIASLGAQIFREDFKQYGKEIQLLLQDTGWIENVLKYCRSEKAYLIKKAKSLREEAENTRIKYSLEWTDFSGGSRSFALKFSQLGEEGVPIPELTDKQAENIHDIETWYTKKSTKKDQIETAYHESLYRIIAEFEPMLDDWNTIQAISKNVFVFGVFRNLIDELSQLKDEENIMLISDANEFLKEITQENDAPFIYEKVGNQYKHFLIDEFQDTSAFQWASFRPLLENSLAANHRNLLVGDVKQSIYRWRGGDLKLLMQKVEDEIGAERIQIEDLDTNFRSLPNIIHFNNSLFSGLPDSFAQYVQDEYGVDDADLLIKAFREVGQKVSPQKQGANQKGKVRFDFIPTEKSDEDDLNFKEKVLEELPGKVMQLQDLGYKLKDIAFLVRTKSEGEEIADCMMEAALNHPGYRFEVLSDESMFLHKSASVRCLLAALQFLQDAKNVVAFKTIWYYRAALHDQKVDHELFAINQIPAWQQSLVSQFNSRVDELLHLPLMELVEELIQILDLENFEQAYLSGFKEAVFDFMTNNRADLGGFLDWWEENKEKKTVKIPEGHDAMRILTIHKSKGLQFKVVMMPFLRWSIFNLKNTNIVWTPYQDEAKDMVGIFPVKLQKELKKSKFSEMYAEEALLAYLDNLNLLYVAFTRAEEVLWGMVPFAKEIKSNTSLNAVEKHLQLLLPGLKPEESDNKSLFDEENLCFDFGDWPIQEDDEDKLPSLPDMRWEYRNWSDLLQLKRYAMDFSEEGLAQRKKRNFGVLVHELLEKSSNLNVAKQELESYFFEGRINQEEKELVSGQLDELFKHPVFASWFDPGNQIMVEQGIVLPGGSQRRPDRIVFKKDTVEVVDFKTGEPSSKHVEQVQSYKDIISKMTGKQVKGYLCYLETGMIEGV